MTRVNLVKSAPPPIRKSGPLPVLYFGLFACIVFWVGFFFFFFGLKFDIFLAPKA